MRLDEFRLSCEKLIKNRIVIIETKLKKKCEAGKCVLYGGERIEGIFKEFKDGYITIENIDKSGKFKRTYYYQIIESIKKYDYKKQGKEPYLHR